MSHSFENELEANFDQFTDQWPSEMHAAFEELSDKDRQEKKFLESYKRIASINSWRAFICRDVQTPSYADFFVEAHNDAVSSHVFARLGSWRTALKSLRSCIENVLFSQYYKDHPVEFRKWRNKQHRITFQKLCGYFSDHPLFGEVPEPLTGIPRLKSEYSTLSQAVHSSAPSFRMTEGDGETKLWSVGRAELGAWHTRERETLIGLNLLLSVLYQDRLQGTSHIGLRKAISLAVASSSLQDNIREHLSVSLGAR